MEKSLKEHLKAKNILSYINTNVENGKDIDLQIKFQEIANCLFNNYHIQKGNQEYYFSKIEFYFCNNNHKDIITYPRNLSEGKWFFHQSGFDLTFESLYSLNENGKIDTSKEFYFGGILVREVVKKTAKCELLDGPYKCEWEIFDIFDALRPTTSIPYIEQNKNLGFSLGREIKSCKRHFSYNDEKKTNKYKELINTYSMIDITEQDFIDFLDKKYAYRISEDDLRTKILTLL